MAAGGAREHDRNGAAPAPQTEHPERYDTHVEEADARTTPKNKKNDKRGQTRRAQEINKRHQLRENDKKKR